MSEYKNILLTGSTGLLGSYLLKVLLDNDYYVYTIARSSNYKDSVSRVLDVLEFWGKETISKARSNLRVIEGDISMPDFGCSLEELKILKDEVDVVFHCAALIDFTSPLEKIRRINVGGTKNLLDFAIEFKKLKKINYISTVYVVGTKNNIIFNEEMLDFKQGFNNTYEQSKYEAEVTVRNYLQRGLKISIFRPSMVVGESSTGKITAWNLFYNSLKLFTRGIYDEFPSSNDCFFNIVNVDAVAKAIFVLSRLDETGVYHVVSPNDVMGEHFIRMAADYFGFTLPKFIPLKDFDFNRWTPIQRKLVGVFVPYINSTTKIESSKTQKILANYGFEYPIMNDDNILRMFKYCFEVGFIKKNTNKSLVK